MIVALPSACRRAMANDDEAVAELFNPSEMPRARFAATGSSHPTAAAARTRALSRSRRADHRIERLTDRAVLDMLTEARRWQPGQRP